jgi:hypothetical protein
MGYGTDGTDDTLKSRFQVTSSGKPKAKPAKSPGKSPGKARPPGKRPKKK